MSSTSNQKNKTPAGSEGSSLPASELDKLEAVRDLLFGQNVKEYRNEFKELKEIIDTERQETDQIIADFKSEVLEKLNMLEKKIEQSNKELSEKLNKLSHTKADGENLANVLREMAGKLSS